MNTQTHPTTFAHRLRMFVLISLVVVLVALTPTLRGATPAFKVLIFKNTPALERFHAASVAAGITAIKQMGVQHNFTVDETDQPSYFTAANLAQYRAVIFLSPEGQTFTEPQRQAFQSFIENGGGYVGIHGAMYMERTTNTNPGWPWYRQLVGANPFGGGPPLDEAIVRVVNKNHPSTANLPNDWPRTDEWYGFQSVSPNVTVLAKVDESTYDPGIHDMGSNHPIAWYQTIGSGRAWYTGGGHYAANWTDEPLFRDHVLGGILWAAHAPDEPTPTATTTATTPTVTTTPPTVTPTVTTTATPGLARRGFVPLVLK